MQLKLDRRFKKKMQGTFDKYELFVGVIEDGPHKEAKTGAGNRSVYAGGPIRKKSGRASGKSISEVSEANRERLGVNYLTEPFQKKNTPLVKMVKNFLDYAFGKSEKKRLENSLQAVVRNPILLQKYGPNSQLTQRIKGFNRNMIDTAQLFKAIKALVRTRKRV